MNYYTVIWTTSAERDLAAAWLASTDRRAVTLAAYQLEQDLRRSPRDVGESRESSVSRVAILPPLSIQFDIIEDDKTVFIRVVNLVS